MLQNTFEANESKSLKRWAKEYMDNISCSECNGSRLRKESLNFKINGKNIAALSSMDVIELTDWFAHLAEDLSDIQLKIAS